MAYLSQRDPRWSGLQLGTSDKTIGAYGCTITALAQYIGVTPDVVNERLKSVNGFAEGSLVIWGKIAEAFPGVSITKIGVYNNEEVLQNLPCLIEVDGAPIGGVRHWVVYIGNQQLLDPWDGEVKPTSTYAPLSYRFIHGAWAGAVQEHAEYYKGLDLTNKDSMKVAIDVWERLQSGELVDKAQFENQSAATTACQTQLMTATEQLATTLADNGDLLQLNKELKSKHEEDQRTIIALKSELETVHKEDKDYAVESYEAQQAKKESDNILIKAADELGVKYNPSDKEGNQLILKAIQEVVEYAKKLEHAFTTQPITQDPRTVTPSPLVSVQRSNVFTSIGDVLFGWMFVK